MTSKYSQVTNRNQFASFEKAREAALTLLALKDMLTPSELETLEILLDKKATDQIAQSVREYAEGKYEPLDTILED